MTTSQNADKYLGNFGERVMGVPSQIGSFASSMSKAMPKGNSMEQSLKAQNAELAQMNKQLMAYNEQLNVAAMRSKELAPQGTMAQNNPMATNNQDQQPAKKSFGQKMSEGMDLFGRELLKLATSATAAAVALGMMTIDTAKVAKENQILGKQFGISASEAKAMSEASSAIFGDSRMMSTMSTVRGSISSEAGLNALGALGISDVKGIQGMNTKDQMMAIIASAQKQMTGDKITDKAAFESSVGGLLGMSVEDLKNIDLSKLNTEIEGFQKVYKGLDSKGFDDLNRAMGSLGKAVTAIKVNLSAELAPVVTGVIGDLVEYITSEEFQDGLELIVFLFKEFVGAIRMVVSTVGDTMKNITSSVKNAFSGGADIKSAMKSMWGDFTGYAKNTAFPSIKKAFGDAMDWMKDKISSAFHFISRPVNGFLTGITDKLSVLPGMGKIESSKEKIERFSKDGKFDRSELRDINSNPVLIDLIRAMNNKQKGNLNIDVKVDKSGEATVVLTDAVGA